VSNTLAIAAVTTTMRHVLHESLGGPEPGMVGGSDVTTYRPAQLANADTVDDGDAGLNVYLYRVTPNHAWNLADLPTRRGDGTLARRPLAALDLHYLVTAYGDDGALEPQRLLARGALALAATPVFTRPVISAALAKYAVDDTAYLADSDLADQTDVVKVSPAPLSTEEISKLWGTFSTPYLLSLGYTATVVLMEAQVTPRAALPVLERGVDVRPLSRPELLDVAVEGGGPSVTGAILVLTGSALLAAHTQVTLGEHRIAPESDSTTTRVRATIPASVPAGLHGVAVLQLTAADPVTGAPERTRGQSGMLPWLVQPRVGTVSVVGAIVRIPVTPAVQEGQRAAVTFGRLAGGLPDDPAVVGATFAPLARADAPATHLDVATARLPAGTWLVRVEVDGVLSQPTMTGDTYDGPAVPLP
jgi:hypothetical protein